MIASSTTRPIASTKRQQRQKVDREAERQQHGQRPHQRKRNRHHGDEHGAPRAQEQEHDGGHDRERLEQRRDDLGDRGIHEFGRVVDDLRSHASGQLGPDIGIDVVVRP